MTVQNMQKGTERGQWNPRPRAQLAKTHQDYWQARLRKRSYTSQNGTEVEIPTWQVRLKHLGRESWFNLHTALKAAASVKARDIYLHLIGRGWDDTLARFKGEMEVTKDGC